MAENTYQRKPFKMISTGVNTLTPPDLLPETKFSRLLNMAADYSLGTLQTRQGVKAINSTNMATDAGIGVHTIRELNDNIGPDSNFVGDFVYIVGCGLRVFQGAGTMTQMEAGFSGRPMSFIPWRPNASPRTWMYCYDADKQIKVGRNNPIPPASATFVDFQIGIAPPPDVPTVAGPGGAYRWRYRYRSSITGARSNPSPVPVSTQGGIGATVTPTISTDPQVDFIDIFRQGVGLLDYRFSGSIPNVALTSFTDNNLDVDIQAAEILETDLDQPF